MGTNTETTLAIEACYDAILEPARWPDALQRLADSLDAISCVVRTTQPEATPLDPAALEATEHAGFSELWWERIDGAPDPHVKRPRKLGLVGRGHGFVVEDDISTPEERATLPYYQEIARPGRREWWAAISFESNGRSWCLPMFRDAKRGAFSHDGARGYLGVAPHLGRMIGVAEKLVDASFGQSLSALDRMGCAAVMLDRRGRVCRFNQHADALFGPDLRISHGRLRASDRLSETRLQGLVEALSSRPPGLPVAADPVVIRRDDTPWLMVEAMPITPFGHDLFDTGHALLLLTGFVPSEAPDEALLRRVFGLTPAEARLAAALTAGTGVGSAAATLCIGRETARSQLRSIFAKTGTARQAELSALLSRLQTRRPH
jgi:DNA-binding CsgD family transcriptional regulator/PAS domain-containing protein